LHTVLTNVVHAKGMQIIDVRNVGVFDSRQERDRATAGPLCRGIYARTDVGKIFVNV
jgi:hypothetical protein